MDQECAGRVTTETLSRCTESSSVFWSTAAEREAGAHMLPNLSSWNCFRRREAPGSPLGLPAALSVPRLLSGLTRTSLVKAAGCVGPWYLDMAGCRGHWGACLWPLSQIGQPERGGMPQGLLWPTWYLTSTLGPCQGPLFSFAVSMDSSPPH